jgi:predicted PurR-regulated permease PerM
MTTLGGLWRTRPRIGNGMLQTAARGMGSTVPGTPGVSEALARQTGPTTMPAKPLDILQTALIWIGVVVCVLLLWKIRDAVLLAFGAVLTAMLLRLLGDFIARYLHLNPVVGLAIAILVVVIAVGTTVWLFGAHIASEMEDVFKRAQAAEQEIRDSLAQGGAGKLIANLEQDSGSIIRGAATTVLSASLSAVEGFVILVISAIYLAAQPDLYRYGITQLFVPRRRRWARETLDVMGNSLRLWLLGQLLLMLMTGVLSLAATWLIGLPGPLALGLIAGLTEIVPYVGPFIGAFPAVLVALTQGMQPAIWTMAAYLVIHLFEGYIVGPLVQQWFVTIPPALILLGIAAISLIFGPFGIVVAAPMTVAIFVAVKMFYIRDTLHQPTEIPGEE